MLTFWYIKLSIVVNSNFPNIFTQKIELFHYSQIFFTLVTQKEINLGVLPMKNTDYDFVIYMSSLGMYILFPE